MELEKLKNEKVEIKGDLTSSIMEKDRLTEQLAAAQIENMEMKGEVERLSSSLKVLEECNIIKNQLVDRLETAEVGS